MSQKPTVWFKEQVFDPAQRPKSVYVMVISAEDGVKMTKDDLGINVRCEHSGGIEEHTIPWGNVRQAINVPRADSKTK